MLERWERITGRWPLPPCKLGSATCSELAVWRHVWRNESMPASSYGYFCEKHAKELMRVNEFWREYETRLTAAIAKDPSAYGLGGSEPPDTPEGLANRVTAKMRLSVEASPAHFGRINYRDSVAFQQAAKAVGVPFTILGLNSLYAERVVEKLKGHLPARESE